MLWIEPRAGIAPLIRVIQSARKTLDINSYLLTDRRVLAAIRTDVERGVQVRVLLDRTPYGHRPPQERARLAATGAQVRWAPTRFTGRYRFDHAKYLVTGSTFELGSANLTVSAFTRNREDFWTGRNLQVSQALRTVFQADWTGHRAGPGPRRWLVISPHATQALVRVLEQPGPICVESEEFGKDRSIMRAFRRKGRLATLVLPTSLSSYDRILALSLRSVGVHVRFLAHPYLHTKLIVGNDMGFLGSENFSWTSLHKNREIGLVLGGGLRPLQEQCAHDAAQGTR